ncbi:MAG: hypothetical protein IJX64_02445 [Clostridia bacterium]|nr:hypothetical protein [Clostridia bacterium]
MFGYVRAQREELTVWQDTLYRAVYCGLCKEMGRCTGQCSRLSLSYDMVYLYLVRAALTGVVPQMQKQRCFLHPFRARQMLLHDAELAYAARVSALLTYGKLCDDLSDERGMKRFGKRMLRPVFGAAKQRADLSELYTRIDGLLAELSALEAEKLPSVDAPADIFGKLLAEVFAYGLDGNAEKIAREIGFRTGRWIYAVDAADDMDEDAKRGGYNPFLLLYGGKMDDEQRRYAAMAMQYDLSAAAAALDLADKSSLSPILQNIIYLGMPAAAEKAVREKEKHEQKSV